MPQQPDDHQQPNPNLPDNFSPNQKPPAIAIAIANQLFLEPGRMNLLKGQFLLGPLLFTLPGISGEAFDCWLFRSAASTEFGIGAVGYFKPLDPVGNSNGWMIAPSSSHALFVPYTELPKEVQDMIQHRMHRHMSQFIETVKQSKNPLS